MKKSKVILLVLSTILLKSGILFAQVNFDPKYEKIKSRVSYIPGVKVIRGETKVIVPMQRNSCPIGTVFKFNNGDLQVYDRRSNDGGKTWIKVDNVLEPSTYQYPEPDGEVVMFRTKGFAYPYDPDVKFSAGRPEVRVEETDQKGVFEAKFFRSKDNGRNFIEDKATIYFPEGLDDWSGVLSRKIIRISDGSLLMSIYGRSEKKSEGEWMVSVLRSTDRGKTWHYHSTVAFGLIDGIRGQGFNEPTLLTLPNGRILAFMRSGTGYQGSLGSTNESDPSADMPFSSYKSTPIYMGVSIDKGNTWSNADPITSFGVWPDAVLMENGIIAMSYGRPGNLLTFSKDGGENWGPTIPFFNGLYPPDCGNYLSIAEVAPNILLAVYARTDPNDYWRSEIVGTFFHVKRVSE